MSSQLQVTGEAKIRDIQGPVVANSGVITALDGAANQYVRGDGTLAQFPTSGGGGSSVSYYLNGSVNQGTFGGSTYYQMSKNAIVGTGTNFSTSSNGLLAQFITDANDPDVVSIPSGNWNVEFFMSVSASSGALASFYVEIYKYNGSTFTLLATNVATPEQLTNTTTVDAYFTSVAMPLSAMAITDRLAIRIFANVASKTVTLYTEDNRLCQVVTTFSKGILSINNLTDQSQNLTTGTSGTNFAIVSSGDTHTFNLPIASATNTGKLSSTDWSTFNNKQNALTNPITGTGASGNVAYFDGTTSITAENSFNYDASTNRLGVNTTVPNATIGANAGTDSGYSLLLKNDNANYNGIGFATTSTYGNVIGTEKLGTAPARNLTLLNQSGYISITEVGNLGVNILNPNAGIDIYNSTSSQLWLHTANSGISATDGVRLALFSNNGANLRNFEGAMSITSEGDFQVITLGAENIRVNSADGKVGIGNPTTVSEMLTVNGSIQQSGVLSALLKTNSTGKIIAAVAGTDYVVPSALSGFVPTSRTLTINGTAYDLSADRSWSVGTTTGSGADGRVAYWNGANSITSEAGFIYDSSTNRLGVNTSVPNATIGADAALNSGYGLLIKTGASDYNGIGIAIDSTYGNTIETAKLGTASARNLTLLNQSGYVSLTESGAFGVGILSPNVGIDIYNSTQSQLWLHNAATGITATDGVRLALFNSKEANLRNFDGGLSITAEGDFQIITLGAENLRVNSANGYIGIGNPSTVLAPLHVYNAENAASLLLQTNGATSYSEIAVRNASSVATSYFRQYSASASGTDFGLSRSNLATFFSNFASNFAIGTQNGGDLIFGTANTERARILASNGNMGIGTSTSIAAKLTIYSASEAGHLHLTSNAPAISFTNALSYTYFAGMGMATASNNFVTGAVAGDLAIGTFNTNRILFYSNNTNAIRMVLTGAGDLGLGTSVPDSKLDVRGEVSVAYSADTGIRFWNQERSNWSSIGNTITTTNANLVFRTPAGVALTLENNRNATFTTNIAAQQATFSSSVGIGTSSPARLLNISGGGTDGTQLQINGTVDSAGIKFVPVSGDNWEIQANTSNQWFVYNRTDSAYRLLIDGSGNVGIGTSSPNFTATNRTTLDINGTSESLLAFSNGGTARGYIYNTATDQIYWTEGSRNMQFGIASAGFMGFGTNNTERMRITSGGDVCVNNSSSYGAKLNVKGQGATGDTFAVIVADSNNATSFAVRNDKLISVPGVYGYAYASTANVFVQSDGYLGRNTSSLKYKHSVEDYKRGLVDVLKIRPVLYESKNPSEAGKKFTGFIAEEIDALGLTEFVQYAEDGTPDALQYPHFVALLVKAIQELKAEVELLSNKIVALESK